MSDNIIVGVFSTKGGTGKTTLALNLSLALKELGKVLLVEFDTNYSLSSILKTEATKVADLIEKSQKPSTYNGIHLLTSDGRTAMYEKKPTMEQISKIVSATAEYRYTVFDFHNYPSSLVVSLLQKACITIVPMVPTMAGLGAYIHTSKILDRISAPYLGVVNMVHKSLFGVPKEERTIIEKVKSRGHMWDGHIPYDRKVALAEVQHRSAVAEYPNSPFSRSIKNLAKEVNKRCRQ